MITKELNEAERTELTAIAQDMRRDILKMCHKCGTSNSHLGGGMSCVELLAYLYRYEMNLINADKGVIEWNHRDRFILSKGHAGIAMYAGMKHAGLLSQQDIDTSLMRGDTEILFRHPKINIPIGIECSSGSLGMGVGYGNGLAEILRLDGNPARVYVMLGDGECNEGSVWESAAYAGHAHLDKLIVIIDKNNFQLDGRTQDVLCMDNLAERWQAFGFAAVEIDGHDFSSIHRAFQTEHVGKPLAIIAHTIKGKGISFAENKVEWHDNYLSDKLYKKALQEVGESEYQRMVRNRAYERFCRKNHILGKTDVCKLSAASFSSAKIEKWNDIQPKNALGDIIYHIMKENQKFILLFADCANRIEVKELIEKYPSNCFETGIAEQNMILMAAAIANEGYPVAAVAYAPFITARILDQIRVNMGYMQAPVCLIGLSAGAAASDLGPTHTAFEDIANLRAIPKMNVWTVNCSSDLAAILLKYSRDQEPTYIRVTESCHKERICVDAQLTEYEVIDKGDKKNGLLILICDSIFSELKKILNGLHGKNIVPEVVLIKHIKPFPKNLVAEMYKYDYVVVLEEHNVIGGVGSAVAEETCGLTDRPRLLRIGIQDCYFKADLPENTKRKAGISASGIVKSILEFISER